LGKKKKNIKRDFIEWGVIICIGAILYFTGLHTQVIGTLQGFVLETGIIRPDISEEKPVGYADYGFVLMDSDGNQLRGEQLNGKVVFMNFWATWCPPCIAEMPDINDLYLEMNENENLKFIMISLDDDFNKAINFVKRKEFDFEIYRFVTPIPETYASKVIPTTYVISSNKEIVVKKEGMAKYDSRSFKNFLKSLL
jgi:thiol-disulfide isomerase/thioredoxin